MGFFFWIKVGPATWDSVFLSGATFLSLSFHFWKRHLECKDFSSCNKKITGDDLWFFGNIGKRRTILPTCQHPFFCFTLLLRCCSGTSALTSQLAVTQFLHHTKQRRGSSAIPECSEEDESWLGANWKQVRAGVTSFCCFPNLWQMFLMEAWLVWFAVLAGALILFLLWSFSFSDQAAGRMEVSPPPLQGRWIAWLTLIFFSHVWISRVLESWNILCLGLLLKILPAVEVSSFAWGLLNRSSSQAESQNALGTPVGCLALLQCSNQSHLHEQSSLSISKNGDSATSFRLWLPLV